MKISKREKEVLQLITYEYNTKEIAGQLYISRHTVDSHRKNLMSKLDVKNVAGLVRRALQLELVYTLLCLIICSISYAQGEIEFRTDGVVAPRVDSATVISPSIGQVIYDTNTGLLRYYDGATWQNKELWSIAEDTLYFIGNVGIGTASPQEQLEITGNLRLPTTTDTSGIIYSHTTPWIHIHGEDNLYLDSLAGNFTSVGKENVAIGSEALHRDSSVVTSTAIGVGAMKSLKSGNSNTAIGLESMDVLQDGAANTAIGLRSLFLTDISDNNTAVGTNSFFLSSGMDNTAIGQSALVFSDDSNQNTMVGAFSGTALADFVSDHTYIGADIKTTGTRDNISIIGTGIVSEVFESGLFVLGGIDTLALKVGVGDTSPDAQLEIAGDSTTSKVLIVSSSSDTDGDIITVTGSGRLGKGDTTPDALLDIALMDDQRLSLLDLYGLLPERYDAVRMWKTRKVGFSEPTPGATLHVGGDTLSSDIIGISRYEGDPGDILKLQDDGRLGINEINPQGLLELSRDTSSSDIFLISTAGGSGGDLLMLTDNGRLGLGSTAPNNQLTLAGEDDAGSSIALNNANSGNRFSHLEMRSQGAAVAQVRSFSTGTSNGELSLWTSDGGALSSELVISPTGEVGIGTTIPTMRLEIENNAIDGALLRLDDSDGRCSYNPESGTLLVSCTSDRRLKTNIRPATQALNDIMRLQVRDYRVKASGSPMTGLIAQEVMETDPSMVSSREDGYLMVSNVNHWKMVKALQELQTQNISQRQQIDAKERSIRRKIGHLKERLKTQDHIRSK